MSTLCTENMNKINNIAPENHKFLQRVSAIDKPAKRLWFQGDISENLAEKPIVAIVGSRKPTEYGREVTLSLAAKLARHDVVIVSGLAYGHDALAAQGALDGGGTTLAIVGNGLNKIYPAKNRPLADKILQNGGAVISEYEPDAEVRPWQFLERNRLIVALADIVIVIEAGEKSGTLNTAAHALGQNKELMAVPGNITSPLSIGCNKLIAQGAGMVLGVDDVLARLHEIFLARNGGGKVVEQLSFDLNYNSGAGVKNPSLEKPLSSNDDAETKILKLLHQGLIDGDEIMLTAGLSAADYSATLTILEIGGKIRSLGANRWALK
jgi:DNA processing protein